MTSSKWIQGRVVAITRWTPTLFSVRFTAPGFAPFVAGQFARVGLPIDGEIVGRPYSLVNAPDDETLEIFAIEVESGPLSPKLNALAEGDPIYVMPRATGFFSVTETPSANVLWCLSTGTGLGPFLSMLRTQQVWAQYQRVVLVHGARTNAELAYRSMIDEISKRHPTQLMSLSLVSREPNASPEKTALVGRITERFDDRTLEVRSGAPFDANSHTMLCGNPQMVNDMIARLEARGLRKHRKREPGHYTTEAYW